MREVCAAPLERALAVVCKGNRPPPGPPPPPGRRASQSIAPLAWELRTQACLNAGLRAGRGRLVGRSGGERGPLPALSTRSQPSQLSRRFSPRFPSFPLSSLSPPSANMSLIDLPIANLIKSGITKM